MRFDGTEKQKDTEEEIKTEESGKKLPDSVENIRRDTTENSPDKFTDDDTDDNKIVEVGKSPEKNYG